MPIPSQQLQALYQRPGYLLRRANQISSALFMEEAALLAITTTQYGVLTVLSSHAPIDQTGIARLLRLDRSTTGLVIKHLEERALIRRVINPTDRRKKMLGLTEQGHAALKQIQKPGKLAHDRCLSVFSDKDAADFIRLLTVFVEGHDDDIIRQTSGSTVNEQKGKGA